MTTDPSFPSILRRQAAEREVRDRYWAAYQKLTSDMQHELDEIEKRFWNGEFK